MIEFRVTSPVHSIALALALIFSVGEGEVFSASAAVREIFPGSGVFKSAAEALTPGDTLILHQGTYTESARNSIQVQGSASLPVVIKGAPGEARPVLQMVGGQNAINIEGSASYLTLQGFEITNPGAGDGIRMSGSHTQITITNMVIHDIDIGISPQTNVNGLTITNNHIYNTGMGNGTGEAMYVGCHLGDCSVQNGLIANNWIHDSLPGTTQGDGIEVKWGSINVIIRDNVVYNRPYPCITVYGYTGSTLRNTVEGNVVWNCKIDGIFAASDAVVKNNIIFDSDTGLSLYGHSVTDKVEEVTAINNTLFNNAQGVYMRWGQGANTVNRVLANNAIYSPGQTAVDTGGYCIIGTAKSNYVEGALDCVTIDNNAFFNGGSHTSAFVNSSGKNVWLKQSSPLVGAANSSVTTYVASNDFNSTSRGSAPLDVGAYETNGQLTNPGWGIIAGFKNSAGGDITPPAAPTNLRVN